MPVAVTVESDLRALASEILEAVSLIGRDGSEVAAKQKAIQASKQILQRLTDSRVRCKELMLNMRQTPIQAMCVRIAVDLNIFNILSELEGAHVTASELAEQTCADASLIIRIMRVLTASGFASEFDTETYGATAFTDFMTDPGMEASFRLVFDQTSHVAYKTPEFFRKEGFQNPKDAKMTPFKFTYETSLEYFPWLESHPSAQQDFAKWMSSKDGVSRGWLDWFPVQERILEASTPDIPGHEALVVDVGGGKGHDLQRFRKRFPNVKGKLILQDRPAMALDKAPDEAFEILPHDFFTPQPIQGARVYYLNNVLHDWPDSCCREILGYIKDAMTEGYSKVIINEAILPERGVPLGHAARDLGMMLMLGAYERTEKHWRDLVESVGFKTIKVWYDPVPGNGVIEVEL